MKNIKRISLLLSWKICNSRLCWILLLLVLSVGLKAQTKTVSGTIVDASGESIIGVNIVVKGTTNGVITDFDGNFTLTNVPEKGIISVTVGSINSIFYFLHKAAEPFNCLEQGNLA